MGYLSADGFTYAYLASYLTIYTCISIYDICTNIYTFMHIMYTYMYIHIIYTRSYIYITYIYRCIFLYLWQTHWTKNWQLFFSLCCHNQFVELFKIGDQDSFIVIALCIQPNVSAHTPARCLFAVIFHQSRNEQRLQTLSPIYYQWIRGKEKNCLSK